MFPTIFVSIASYRDPDCQNTVSDLIEKAAFPERVVIGICLQVVPDVDSDCMVVASDTSQLRILQVEASQSQGACWARSRVQSLWQGEDYFFQVDSHMRFVSGWDEKLIAMLKACGGEKPVLSTYPLEFTPPDQFAADGLVTIRPKGFDDDGVLTQNSNLTSLEKAPARPATSPFIGAGMLFTLGQVVKEVPYDPYLYFTGEEITLGARLWTSGWDIYCPNEVIAYHNYTKQPSRPRHWADQTDWGKLNRRSRHRIRHLLGMETVADNQHLEEISKFSLGSVRTLAEYETFSKLDFKRHLFRGQPHPLPDLRSDQPDQAAARRRVFSQIFKENFWANEESRSGTGSTLAATAIIRDWLPKTLDFLGVKVLGDAGCGDVNWMKELTGSLRLYLGFEIVPELVNELRTTLKERANCFFSEADIVTAPLPDCDAILCRDCLTHLTLDGAMMALKNFRRSGSRYLIATTHHIGHNAWVKNGGWYPMDLTAAPFNLPVPRLIVAEGKTKALAVWSMADLPE